LNELLNKEVDLDDGFQFQFSPIDNELWLFSHCCGTKIDEEQARKILEVVQLKLKSIEDGG